MDLRVAENPQSELREMKKSILFLAFAIVLLLATTSDGEIIGEPAATTNPLGAEFIPSFTPKDPFAVTSNLDFILQGWTGTGTSGNPYVIEGYEFYQSIANEYCIRINDTTSYFVIRNCTFAGASARGGIYLESVINARIENCSFSFSTTSNYGVGVHLNDCSYNTIANVTTNCHGHGINLQDSTHNVVANSTCEGGSDGIWVDGGMSNTITDNTLQNNGQGGIMLLVPTESNIVMHNLIVDCRRGIHLDQSPGNIIIDNTMINCGFMNQGSGVMSYCLQSEVRDNTVNGKPLIYNQSVSNFIVPAGAGQVNLVNCQNAIVENQMITHTTMGIILMYCNNISVLNNKVSFIEYDALFTQESRNIVIDSNDFSDSISGSNLHGQGSTDNFNYTNNLVERCEWGLTMYVYDSIARWNTFIDNNQWTVRNYLSGNLISHNFYDDYSGIDSNSNYYGDTPYSIGGSVPTTDEYPLMYNPSPPEWIIPPTNVILEENIALSKPLYVSGIAPINEYWVNDTTHFHLDGSSILENATALPIDQYGLKIGVSNVYNRTLNITITIDIIPDSTNPTINAAGDMLFELGEPGYEINWTPDDLNPLNYTLYVNNVTSRTGLWNSSSESITVNLDGIPEGVHNYTLLIGDIRGNVAVDVVIVEVYVDPPSLDAIDELSIIAGTTGNLAEWWANGTFPLNYSLYLNGNNLRNGIWNSSSEVLQYSLDNLGVGIYTLRLKVNNTAGMDETTTVVYVFTDEFQTHAPISIMSDSDFITQSLPGSGTEEDPYIIAGLNITDLSDCIYIQDTTSHFIIFNCYISTPDPCSGYGIRLEHLDYGDIINCTFVSKSRAIAIWWCNFIHIRDCYIIDSWNDGISISNVTDFEVLRCAIENEANTGIGLSRSFDGVIEDCYLYGDGMYQMVISECLSLNITGNYFEYGGLSIDGDELRQFTSIHFEGNIVDGKQIGVYVNQTDLSLNGNLYGQYILINCTDVTVTGGVFDYGFVGITLAFCTDCVIDGASAYMSSGNPIYLTWCAGCIIRNCNFERPVNHGINVHNSLFCQFYDNTISQATDGISLWRCSECSVYSNIVTNGYSGVYLSSTNHTYVFDNIFDANHAGVDAYSASFCIVYHNSLQQNRWNGLRVYDSHDCEFRDNTILENEEYGIYVWGGSYDNLFYLNLVGDNDILNALDDSAYNDWDNGSIGNAWRDYIGSGVYNISGVANSVDHFPRVLLYIHIPTISYPPNVEYDLGTTNHYLTWGLSNYFPGNYYIYRDDVFISSDILTSSISISVDGLVVGSYEYTIIIAQTGYENVTDIAFATVVLDSTYPTIDSPTDITYLVGLTGYEISWTPYDMNPNYYEIRRDGDLVDWGSWESSWTMINITVDGLSVGVYQYILAVSDIAWNNISDIVQVTVLSETPPPEIDNPDDVSYYFGSWGYNVTWHVYDENPFQYEIYFEGELETQVSWNLGEWIIFWDLNGFDIGTHNVTLVLIDTELHKTSDTIFVYVLEDVEPPTVNNHGDIEYFEGDSGNWIIWTPSDNNPSYYIIFVNESMWRWGEWNSSSEVIQVNVDGLEVGVHIYELLVSDCVFNTTDRVIVSVLQLDSTIPEITPPDDIVYFEGEVGNNITWVVYDEHPGYYEVSRNGTFYTYGIWNETSDSITICVDGLEVGVYLYDVLVGDSFGNNATDLVIVIVLAAMIQLDSPPDVQYQIGTTENTITWNIISGTPTMIEIIRNGSTIVLSSWVLMQYSLNVDYLQIGVYNFTVRIQGMLGDSDVDTVWVRVYEDEPTGTTTTGTTGTTSITQPTDTAPVTLPEFIGVFSLIITIGSGLVIIFIIILIIRSRTTSTADFSYYT